MSVSCSDIDIQYRHPLTVKTLDVDTEYRYPISISREKNTTHNYTNHTNQVTNDVQIKRTPVLQLSSIRQGNPQDPPFYQGVEKLGWTRSSLGVEFFRTMAFPSGSPSCTWSATKLLLWEINPVWWPSARWFLLAIIPWQLSLPLLFLARR